MPMQELDISALKGMTTGTAVKKALASAELPERTASASLKVPNVSGEAALSKARLTISEKDKDGVHHKWVFVQASGIVQTPSEYNGQFVNPQYIFDAAALNDSEAAADAVSGMMGFLNDLGIPGDRINSLRSSGAFFADAVKLIDSSKGARFRYATKVDKKNTEYVRYFANGAVAKPSTGDKAPAQAAEAATTDGTEGFPADGEVWSYNGGEFVVTNADSDALQCDLTAVGGGDTQVAVPYFNEAGEQLIEFVRSAE